MMPMHNEHVLLLASIIMLDIPQQITLHLAKICAKNEVWASSFVCPLPLLGPRRVR